uniref:Protein KRI1 homolog n=1 Tax=Melopsittacus undulatus TaxID=13146 RepID=A0A8V5GY35_MELUD
MDPPPLYPWTPPYKELCPPRVCVVDGPHRRCPFKTEGGGVAAASVHVTPAEGEGPVGHVGGSMAAPKLRVNAAFAERLKRSREREELRRRRKWEWEREWGEGQIRNHPVPSPPPQPEDPVREREFYRMLSLLKTRDPRLYHPDATFYTPRGTRMWGGGGGGGGGGSAALSSGCHLLHPQRYPDGGGGGGMEGDMEGALCPPPRYPFNVGGGNQALCPPPSFQPFMAESEDEDEDGGGSALLRPRAQTEEEKVRGGHWGEGGLWVPLQRFWTDPELEPGERFLRDYILERGYRDREEEEEEGVRNGGGRDLLSPPQSDSSDEGQLFLAKQEQFERSHNFRFQEPGAQQVQTFPRSIPTSVRRPDERRKEKREQTRERKRKRRRQELQQLKNLRRAELCARLQQLHRASGAGAGITADTLRGDFDPEQHDRIMAECFGDHYYGQEEEEKPQFEAEEGLEDDWNWDTWTGPAEGGAEQEPHCEDPDFVVSAGPPPMFHMCPPCSICAMLCMSHTLYMCPPCSVCAPHVLSLGQYLDEFYGLDHEDVIGGDLPCRFRYRRVLPCDFGLTTEEILAADDKELNRWCSLRKTCMYRSEQEERQDQANYRRRAQDTRKKQQILKSLFTKSPAPDPAPEPQPQPKRRRSRRSRRSSAPLGSRVRLGGQEFTGSRLAAFGLSARRIRYRQRRKGGGNK